MKIPLLGQTGEGIDPSLLYQKTQNWYPVLEQEGVSQLSLFPTPGHVSFGNIGTGPIRGMIEVDGSLYVVSNNTLYFVNLVGIGTAATGTLSTSTGRVQLVSNGSTADQILVLDGTAGYIYTISTNTVAVISDIDFPDTATTCAFMDSFFLVNEVTVSGRFRQSAVNDGTTWSTDDYDAAERSSDALVRIIPSNRLLYLLGEKTCEVWYNSGKSTGSSFEAADSGFSQWGCVAPDSAKEIGGTVFWLSQNDEGRGLVIQMDGMDAKIISTAVDSEIQDMTTIQDAYSWSYQYKGHTFYVLSFPTEEKTLVYDISTKMWHQFRTESTGVHNSLDHVYCYGKHIIADVSTNELYSLDWDTFTDNGETIHRIRRSRHMLLDDNAVRHQGVWIDIKEAVGNIACPDPQITLRFKDNNGAWTSPIPRSMGKVGEYNTRCIWRRLGRSRNRVYELKVTDPVRAILLNGYAKLDKDQDEMA